MLPVAGLSTTSAPAVVTATIPDWASVEPVGDGCAVAVLPPPPASLPTVWVTVTTGWTIVLPLPHAVSSPSAAKADASHKTRRRDWLRSMVIRAVAGLGDEPLSGVQATGHRDVRPQGFG